MVGGAHPYDSQNAASWTASPQYAIFAGSAILVGEFELLSRRCGRQLPVELSG
jgi:hypothetical protein